MKRELAIVVAVLAFLSLIPLADLFHPGLPLTHDGPDHVARIANFYQSLSEGKIVPRWAGNLNWGFGHPILMFLYPLPSYVASLFHSTGFSLVDSTKLVFATSYLVSILTFYLWASVQWGRTAGFVGAILYGFAPYRFVDLYVRGALGEHLAFAFPPIIFWGLYRLARDQKKIGLSGLIVSGGAAGLILSHNAVSLMFAPIIVLYLVYLVFFEAKERIRFFVLGSWFLVLGSALSAFFWIPAFFEGKYTLRDIVTRGEFAGRFVPWSWFIRSPWNYGGSNEFTKEVGLAGWIAVVASITMLFGKIRAKGRWFIAGSLVVFFVSLFLMTAWSLPIWNTVSIIQKFQFPWRLLTVGVFITSVLAGMVVLNLPSKFAIFVSVIFFLASFVSTRDMWRVPGYVVKPDSYYSGIYEGTTDTGESSPIWSVRFMEKRAVHLAEVITGNADIVPLKRLTTRHEYRVAAKTKSRIVDNTLYFPGWQVTVDGRPLDLIRGIVYQDPDYRGLMTFWVEPGEHQVVVAFGDTKLRKTANVISLLGLALLIGTVTIPLVRRE